MLFRKRNALIGALVGMLILTPILADIAMIRSAKGLSLACSRSEACRAAAAKEEEANKNATAASNSASMFQNKVNALNSEIVTKELEIAETVAQVDELKVQIKAAEMKLNDEQEALAELLVNMHFEGDSEPIQILAGSSSISDLAEKQARTEVVKQQISATASKIKEMKKQLEDDKAQVEELLAQQKEAKAALESSKAELSNLVAKYQNDAAAYEAEAKVALAEKLAAEEAEQRAHPELYGNGKYYSGANTYYWQDICPEQQDWDFSRYPGVGIIGGYLCECTSYAGWKAFERYGYVIRAWGDAKSWASSARYNDLRVDNSPAAGTIGQTTSGYYGHVFWVESVNADGSINITEYNNYWSTGQLTGSYHMGDFGSQTISADRVPYYNFIHFD